MESEQMIRVIFNEMLRGNFSFAILLVGIAQLVVMCLKGRDNNKNQR